MISREGATTMLGPTPKEVQFYYDQFMRETMLEYRLDGNMRIEKATAFFLSHVRSNDVIIDVGCGIGIATEAMANAVPDGFVLGLDISEENIWYANKTVKRRNLLFRDLNVTKVKPEEILTLLPRRPTVITLCDVIEHIPEDSRIAVLRQFADLGSEDLRVLLTFPSEYYQALLRRDNAKELQIIDNAIGPAVLAHEARTAGLSMTCFHLIDVWRKAQYVHCVLRRDDTLAKAVSQTVPEPTRTSLPIFGRLRRRYLRWRYVDRVFNL
jgi:trans-aconitate 2-methyltransferase